MIRSKSGLIIYDANYSAHSVSFKKDSFNNALTFDVSMLHGPPGKRAPESCAASLASGYIFPRSRPQYRDFHREQERHLNRSAAAALAVKDYDLYHKISENTTILQRFHEEFSRRIVLVMGEWESLKSHHVSRWAVLLHFLIVTWNTAMVRGDFSYLIADFDNRWTKEFEPRTTLSNGKTVARIEECLKFLIYTCDTPACGAGGMCNQLCFHCKTTSKTASALSKATASEKSEKNKYWNAWNDYLKGLGPNKSSGTKELFFATTAGAPFAKFAKSGATPSHPTQPSAKCFNNLTEFYAYLETHQELVIQHASPHSTYN